jgi:hypothetical protein
VRRYLACREISLFSNPVPTDPTSRIKFGRRKLPIASLRICAHSFARSILRGPESSTPIHERMLTPLPINCVSGGLSQKRIIASTFVILVVVLVVYKASLEYIDARLNPCVLLVVRNSVSATKKNDVHRSWMMNQTQVVVATIAFGLGINKP